VTFAPSTRRVRRLGWIQRDVLDTLRQRGRSTISEVSQDTGAAYGRVAECLTRCLSSGLVSRVGNRHTRTGSEPWFYALTSLGRDELALREQIGHEPGVPCSSQTDRLAAPLQDRPHLVLAALAGGPRTRRDLAAELGLALGTLRHLLPALRQHGLADRTLGASLGRGGQEWACWEITPLGRERIGQQADQTEAA
jgi:DNA-binding MarR family transcriptional regulator